jgi:hypothetical protein
MRRAYRMLDDQTLRPIVTKDPPVPAAQAHTCSIPIALRNWDRWVCRDPLAAILAVENSVPVKSVVSFLARITAMTPDSPLRAWRSERTRHKLRCLAANSFLTLFFCPLAVAHYPRHLAAHYAKRLLTETAYLVGRLLDGDAHDG